jgi:glycosyltransferase involved in cell wall biosynthesis
MVKIVDAPVLRVLFVSTHVQQSTGYAKMSWNLLKELGKKDDVELIHYGFQKFGGDMDPNNTRLKALPESIIVHDVSAAEVPAEQGFGFKKFRDFVRLTRPDVLFFYNDALIVSRFFQELSMEPHPCPNARIVTYIDTVYPFVNPDLLAVVERNSDHIITFTSYWKDQLIEQGVRKPLSTLMHGFDDTQIFPIERPKRADDAPMICLNLNRNTFRKRYDLMAITMALLFSKRPDANVKFIAAADLKSGAWDVPRIYARELCKRMKPEQAATYLDRLLTIPNPSKMTDDEINRLYNEADIGLNFAQGEGVGLCTFEHAGLGKPQICGRLGGFTEYLDDTCAALLGVTRTEYVDSRDMVGGEASIVDPEEACDAILAYLDDPKLREKHGNAARARVLQYKWPLLADKLHKVLTES